MLAGFAGGAGAALVIKILTDAKGAQKGMDEAASGAQKLQGRLGGLAVPAAAALTAVVAVGAGAVDAASKAEQAWGALEATFGDQAAAARKLAEESAQSVGLASSDYAQMAAVLGAQLKNMGVAQKDILPTTEALIKQGADLAAQFGGPTSDAVAAISSLLRGERDPIERYGVGIKEATLQAEIGADKLKKMSDSQATAAKTAATLALLTEQTATAHGAFAREADTAAGAAQRSAAEYENAQASLGEALLPAVTAVTTALTGLFQWLGKNDGATRALLITVGAIAAAILAANVALKVYSTVMTVIAHKEAIAKAATAAYTAVQWLLNAALSANPIGLVVLAIAALVGALILAYNKSEAFRRVVDAAFRAVGRIVGIVVEAIVALFKPLGSVLAKPFEALVGIVRTVFGTIRGIVEGAVSFIEGLLGGIEDALNGVADFIDTIAPGGKAAAPAPAAAGRMLGAPVPGLMAALRAPVRLHATVTHEVRDPGGALASLPGGARGVAAELNRGAEVTGLYRNLQHAAGLR